MPLQEVSSINTYILETAICYTIIPGKDELAKLKKSLLAQMGRICPFQTCNRKYKKTQRVFDKYTKHWDRAPRLFQAFIEQHLRLLSRLEYQTYLTSKLDEMETILSQESRCGLCLACRRDTNKGSHRAFLSALRSGERQLRNQKLVAVNFVLKSLGLEVEIRHQDVSYPEPPEEDLNWSQETYLLYRNQDFYIDLLADAILEYRKEPNPILQNAIGLAFDEGIYTELEDYTGFYADELEDDTDSLDVPEESMEGEAVDARNL